LRVGKKENNQLNLKIAEFEQEFAQIQEQFELMTKRNSELEEQLVKKDKDLKELREKVEMEDRYNFPIKSEKTNANSEN
jgi:septal ring factor EnvC (AmiA/AmiB activator)